MGSLSSDTHTWIACPMSVWANGPEQSGEGGPHVVDNRSNTAGSVAAGVGEQLHHGRVHPYFARARNCSVRDQSLSGTKNCINDLQVFI